MQKYLKEASSQTNTLKRKAEDNWRSHVEIVKERGKGHYIVVCQHGGKGTEPDPCKTTSHSIKGHSTGNDRNVAACKKIPQHLRFVSQPGYRSF
jgi:hypothetical protein